MTNITVNEALDMVAKQAQWCRENGESDMRTILNTVRWIKNAISEGKSKEEILGYFEDEDEE